MTSKKNWISKCRPEPNYHVWIQFEDGLEGIVNLNDLLQKPAFRQAWQSEVSFNQVRISPFTHTLTWGEEGKEIDINPHELRKEILNKKNDQDKIGT
ncbi:MAG: DUF2442 domain-containing protein [Parachlamydia sp.]|jgi:hypothetical protein|nr:DUF2442 domain-containing protein [Parachlamydia sp.]